MPHSGEGYGRVVEFLEAIDKIARFTKGLDETSFSSNAMVRDVLEQAASDEGEGRG